MDIKKAADIIKKYSLIQEPIRTTSAEYALNYVAKNIVSPSIEVAASAAAYWMEFAGTKVEVVAEVVALKNSSYGNAIENPVCIFCQDSPSLRVMSRLDDKASRVLRGKEFLSEDSALDISGYLLILIALEM